jgi:deoxyribodipyrimidine photo-lyase
MMDKKYERALVWFRRDLRSFDHAALYHALVEARAVYCAFVFDREILDKLPDAADRRVEFIWESVAELAVEFAKNGGALIVRHGFARRAIPELAILLKANAVYANHDYEPVARDRDAEVGEALKQRGIAFVTSKDQVIVEHGEILTRGGEPFRVFTPYKRAWLQALTPSHVEPYPVERYIDALAKPPTRLVGGMPSLKAMGFARTNLETLGVGTGMSGASALLTDFKKRIGRYREARDYPAVKGPSYLSVHLRFGTVSIRALASFAHGRSLRPGGEGAATWLSELIWRDFYAQILWHHPQVVAHAFKAEYDALEFPNDPDWFAAWCEGRTGYPIVDAAMRQLNTTGYMHNRLRMITASFLVKDLLVDWRLGEKYFADKLIDFDLASNNGGWQWAASTGCDAQPYFRIFNPVTQSERFDPAGKFIRRYVPEIAELANDEIHAPWRVSDSVQQAKGAVIGHDYPPPIVDHGAAREAVLALFKRAR